MTKKTHRPTRSATAAATKANPTRHRKRQGHRTKKEIAISLLERPKGATIPEMRDALGWQDHSVRGFLAGTVRKLANVTLVSEKSANGPRRYHIVRTAA